MNEALDFGQALIALKIGKFLQRKGWNGKGMYVFLVGGSGQFANELGTGWTYTNGRNDNFLLKPFLALKTADDKVIPWTVSQDDVLAEDWQIFNGS